MKYYFAGAEVASHRKVLTEVGAPSVALSYLGLRRRVKFARPWVIAEKFPAETEIFLDSGGYTVNQGDDKYSQRELLEIAEHYREFVTENIDRLSLVSEFDALPLGRDWIEQQRADFYEHLPADKFMPIWHPDWSLDYLEALADSYENVGVPATHLGGRNLVPMLNQIAAGGTSLHGVGITSVEDMKAIRWHSVSSTSWVSPQQYGDTIIWTGRELKRYPKKYKEQARRRYRTMFEREGFDSQKIEDDDSTELLRLSIWSWQKLMDDIDKKRPGHLSVVTNPPETAGRGFVEEPGEEVDHPEPEERKSLATVSRETVHLPVLGIRTETVETIGRDGEPETHEVAQISLRSDSGLKCASCFLATKCPAFEPNSNCAYNIPIEIKTKDQFMALQNALVEMQAQRVMFMRFAEQQEGGYSDPNLSSEIDRLQKLLKTKHEMEEEGFSLKVDMKAKGGAQMGVLGRLFGEQASQAAQALPSPIPVENALEGTVVGEWDEI